MSVRRQTRSDLKDGGTRDFWVVDIDIELPDGRRQRVRKVSPIQTRRGSEEYEREVRSAIVSGRYGKNVVIPTFTEVSTELLEKHAGIYNKRSEYVSKESILRNHLIPFFNSKRLNEIGSRDTADYIAAKIGAGLTAKTINNHLIVLRKMLNLAVEWKYLQLCPKIKNLPTIAPKINFLSFQEKQSLLDAARNFDGWYSAVVVALDAGLRLGELIALQWCDITDWHSLTVARSDWHGHLGLPKGGRSRTIQLNKRVVDALKAHQHQRGPWIWCREDGTRFNKDDFRSAMKRVRDSGSIRQFGWHSLRHTFASHLVMHGIPLKQVQEYLGHVNIATTMRYAHLLPSVGRLAVDSLMDESPVGLRQPDGNEEKPKFVASACSSVSL